MPFINTKLSIPLTKETEQKLKKKLGEAIAILPGKTEKWLMVNFEDNCRLWFAGDNSRPTAYLEVSAFGAPNPDAYAEMTAFLCQTLEELCGISPDRVYVKYGETANWGWNGGNF